MTVTGSPGPIAEALAFLNFAVPSRS